MQSVGSLVRDVAFERWIFGTKTGVDKFVDYVFPDGITVKCGSCLLMRALTKKETEEFLLNGLECCGESMKL